MTAVVSETIDDGTTRSPLHFSASALTRDRSLKSVENDAQKESALRTVCPRARGARRVSDAAKQ
jgi:hypothetical protein